MEDFFTNHVSQPPVLGPMEQGLLFSVFLILLYLSSRYYRETWFRTIFWWLQLVQIVSLYTWYAVMDFPLSESLPLYHCRLAMLFVLWGKPGPLKTYFAYLGLFGSLLAFLHPVFDPFAFPHLTFFTFVIGHYALAVNSLTYLLAAEKLDWLGRREVLGYTCLMNLFLLCVNSLLGANYGFLSRPPLVNSESIPLNFLLVTSLLVGAVLGIQTILATYLRKRVWNLQEEGAWLGK